jgi:hypothetical protein
MVETLEQLFRIYAQQTKNLDDPDEPTNETLLVLATRNVIDQRVLQNGLSDQERQRLEQLDDELVKRWEILAEFLPNPNFMSDRARWWWFLHEGPQVREKAKALAS